MQVSKSILCKFDLVLIEKIELFIRHDLWWKKTLFRSDTKVL